MTARTRFSHWPPRRWLVLLRCVQSIPTGNNNGRSGRIACGGGQAYDDRPTCECCGQGKLDLIDERPDPIFAVLGMTCQTLKCDFLECGKLTII
jgi:hypothetical protein